jgi:hypothetical protein
MAWGPHVSGPVLFIRSPQCESRMRPPFHWSPPVTALTTHWRGSSQSAQVAAAPHGPVGLSLRKAIRSSSPLPFFPPPCFTIAGHDCHSPAPSKPGIHIASSSTPTRAHFWLEPPDNDTGRASSPCRCLLPHGSPSTAMHHPPLAGL